MGRIEADIALESWLFGFRPCSGQGQFTLPYLPTFHLGRKLSGPLYDQIKQKQPNK